MEDNICTYCHEDKGESGILAVTECEHFVSSDQCDICETDQVCFECDKASGGRISDRIFGISTRLRIAGVVRDGVLRVTYIDC